MMIYELSTSMLMSSDVALSTETLCTKCLGCYFCPFNDWQHLSYERDRSGRDHPPLQPFLKEYLQDMSKLSLTFITVHWSERHSIFACLKLSLERSKSISGVQRHTFREDSLVEAIGVPTG